MPRIEEIIDSLDIFCRIANSMMPFIFSIEANYLRFGHQQLIINEYLCCPKIFAITTKTL